ncbi:ATP-binding protein [Microtetraspora malaysiensis]|uniref:ATP-binding protein n=1 Tax=Microtetraspora malaysiensis TaxID=161358 RepID=A0ABW6T4T0_9ACTN
MVAGVEISPREAEVLEQVGAHLSNAEIAARLCISVRTVESHVSSLLRKLEVPDRRALAQRAPEPAGAGPSHPAPVLPAPLTSFIGRVSERAELTEMIKAHRQVTAVGPGGVGKTRLALAAATEAAGEYSDGVWFVDLVPVTDPGMIATAVAGALGLGEQPGRDMTESVVAALADRHALLVLDNCEHVVDGVALFLERLLATCPRLTVLATSRARLMVPFERVYLVLPLSLSVDGESDAVALFMERAAAVGWPLDPPLRDQIAAICARLDGMALAIELAAARYPTLGLDGITAALSHPLRMLTGGSRLRGDQDARREWQEVLDQLGTPTERTYGHGAIFDAILFLHHGQAPEALERMAPEPRQVWKWVTWIWLHWYVALRAEAAVLAGSPGARDRVAEARTVVAGNPVATAIVERAQALLDNDHERLLATVAAFDAAGCRYQSLRTLVLAGGDHAERGVAALADLGLAPMAPAPTSMTITERS